MWPKLVTAAEKRAELWALYHDWVTRFNPGHWWEHPLQANLQEEPRAESAPSRCFTLASLILWALGMGMDRADQPAGSFPNHCVLIRWSRESLCCKQTTRWLYRVTLTLPVQAGHWTRGGEAATASLGKVTPKKKRLPNFLDKKPRVVQQSLPSYWNRGLFCQERSASNI